MSFPCCSFREYPPISFVLLVLTTCVNSAILTILQIDGAAEDPITRFSALSSLLCASMSLLFGCMYIIRFGTMRKTYKAAEWALVCTKSTRACRCKHSRLLIIFPGGEEDKNRCVVEHLDTARNAGHLAHMVHYPLHYVYHVFHLADWLSRCNPTQSTTADGPAGDPNDHNVCSRAGYHIRMSSRIDFPPLWGGHG